MSYPKYELCLIAWFSFQTLAEELCLSHTFINQEFSRKMHIKISHRIFILPKKLARFKTHIRKDHLAALCIQVKNGDSHWVMAILPWWWWWWCVCMCVYVRVCKECEITSFPHLCYLFTCKELTRQFSRILLCTLSLAHVIVALFEDLFWLMTSIGTLRFVIAGPTCFPRE